MELKYKKCGDYLIPDVKIPKQPEGTVGRYGILRETYLKEHRSGTYTYLMLQGKLKQHLLDIDREAEEMSDRLTKQMKQQRGVTEQLKASDQMRWVQEMNSIQASVEEIIRNDLIYS